MDSQVHRQRPDRRLILVLAACALLAVAAGAGLRSFAQDAAPPPADNGPCAAIDALYAPQGGSAPFRPLPVLTPAGLAGARTLGLAIRAVRPPGGVMIGDLLVRGVPLFQITPQPGVRASVADPRTGGAVVMPDACLSSASWSYGGTRWAIAQGDRLQVRFTSALDFAKGEVAAPIAGGVSCRAANLHTHGLLVSPYKAVRPEGKTVYGDYVMDAAAPVDDAVSRTGDPCADGGSMAGMAMPGQGAGHQVVLGPMDYDTVVPGAPGQSSHLPGGHPSGLFWFHPHPHGYSGLLVDGGTSGMITVGDIGDYACTRSGDACSGGPAPVRDIFLKDAQVSPDHGGWRLDYTRNYDLEDGCRNGRADDHPGQCGDWRGDRWLFTINGVRNPVISDLAPGRTELWRIVNASPNVTYRLRLRPAHGAADDAGLPFQVLSLEGAGADAKGWAAPGVQRELLLMPAARAEIAVTAPAAGGDYVLEQAGFATGGDVWPAIVLAQVHFAAGASAPAPAIMLHGPMSEALAPDHFYPGPADGCGFAADEVRRIYFVKRPTFADDRRRRDTFGLIATVQTGNGPPMMMGASGAASALTARSWQAMLAADPHAPAYMHNPANAVCTYLGHTETWVLENDTDEAHNFHIHQSEFQLALDRRSDPAFFSPLPITRDAVLGASDRALAAADGQGREGLEAALYHDTIPVPRGVNLGGAGCDGSPMNAHCRPGLVTVRIRFDRDEQIGEFVYHCHILQHEDDGMMAEIRVLCPPGDAACAVRHAGPPR